HSAFVLAVLPRIAEIRDHRRDAGGRGALEAIDEDQQLHQVAVAWRAGRLNHERIAAAHVVLELQRDFAIRKILELHPPRCNAQVLAHALRQRGTAASGKHAHVFHARPPEARLPLAELCCFRLAIRYPLFRNSATYPAWTRTRNERTKTSSVTNYTTG